MAADISQELEDNHNQQQHQLERHMGCMAGFFQLFERHHILTTKKFYSTHRLPYSSNAEGSTSPSERSEASTSSALKEIQSELSQSSKESNAVIKDEQKPARISSPSPFPVFDFKEGVKSHWKLKESPRLSLDSRATVDAKGKLRPREIRTALPAETSDNELQNRSPSVVARLMGIDALPDNKSVLRRSSSESRVARDQNYHKFIDTTLSKFDSKPAVTEEMFNKANFNEFRGHEAKKFEAPTRRKAFFAEDFFPEPKIEKKLQMRGIDDLETLKQILEALQLKGLLHSKQFHPINGDKTQWEFDSPIVVMRPVASRPQPAVRSGVAQRSNARQRIAPRSPESPRRRPWNAGELPKSSQTQRRMAAVNSSPRGSPKRVLPVTPAVAKSPRNRRQMHEAAMPKEAVYPPVDDDSCTTVSESSIGSSFQLDLEQRSRVEDYRSGRSLLERCDKLLSSIAAFTSTAEQQPSPVSVLESSSFLGSNSCSPSPLTKRSIDFNKEELVEWDDEQWSTTTAEVLLPEAELEDYAYVTEILRLSTKRGQASENIYAVLEKRKYSSDASKTARLHRRLVFDTVSEILDSNLNVSSWESFKYQNSLSLASGGPQLAKIWSELLRLREDVVADDLNGLTCGVIKKDMDRDHHNGWTYRAAEMSEAVLNIERLIFKDLVAEAIRELSDVAAKSLRPSFPRRKLEF